MGLRAGIDEAGYGPRLGPLVVAGAAFDLPSAAARADLWELLSDAVARQARGSDGRLLVNDSKRLYSAATGLKHLEEGVLAFAEVCTRGGRPGSAADLFTLLGCGGGGAGAASPWFSGAPAMRLPLATNPSAVASKAAALGAALHGAGVRVSAMRASVVLPAEFNRVVAHTRNKSFLLFQKCGLLLQDFWRRASGEAEVVVDRHGGRMRYRKLLLDAFPHCRCDVLEEDANRSAYRVYEALTGGRAMRVSFLEGADGRAFSVALASMVAKYVREIYMRAFNRYWQARVEGLKGTAGYGSDAGRFLRDIGPLLRRNGVDLSAVVRQR